MNLSSDSSKYDEETFRLKRYLSDEIAPMIFADSASVLFEIPPQIVAAAIQSWIGDQFSGSSNMSASDLIFHAAKKIQHLGELDLIPREDIKPFIDSLKPMLILLCPESERPVLEQGLSHLETSSSSTGGAVEVLRRPAGAGGMPGSGAGGGAGGGVGPAPAGSTIPAAPGSGAGAVPYASMGAEQQALHRLNMLLERLETTSPGPSPVSGKGPSPAQHTLAAQAVDQLASTAGNAEDFESRLGFLKKLGVDGVGPDLVRVLSKSLPDWAAPEQTEKISSEPTTGAERAMRKMVNLSKDSDDIKKRFSELVTVAIEEFNGDSLGRAVTMLELAEKMILNREVDQDIVKKVIDETYPTLDQQHLSTLAENKDQHLLLRRAMKFFPPLRIEGLMEELIGEEDRERRLQLLQLLTAHGATARQAVIEALQESIFGTNPQPWYVDRNLVYLLRSLPREEDEDSSLEIDILTRASQLEGALPLVRESLNSLAQFRDNQAENVLIDRVSELEEVLLGKQMIPHEPEEARSLLNATIKALSNNPTPIVRACIISHGLKRQPQLGDTLARMTVLGNQDLSDTPELMGKITDALEQELPKKFLGMSVKSQRKAQSIDCLIKSLAGTDSPLVRLLLDKTMSKFSGQPFAETAANALAAFDKPAGKKTQEEAPKANPTLTGDLSVFGFPSLLQNLAETKVTGTLKIVNEVGATSASFQLFEGLLVKADAGKLTGEVAVFQLLERPVKGQFVFENQEDSMAPPPESAKKLTAQSLLLEGIRRFDEFNRAAALVPDDAKFKQGNKKPTDVKEDSDPKLAKAVWTEAVHGGSPSVCESKIAVDGFRIRRLFEHWVTEGSLVPQ